METPTDSQFWDSEEAAKLYASRPVHYAPTAVSWILEYYQQTHPDWSPGSSRIPLIVDVACGTGQLSAPLAEHCERLIGIDISPSQVSVARQMNARPNVEYKIGSALELSAHCSAGGVDLIVAGMAAHFFDNDEFYSEVRRCLRPGGVLAIVSFFYHGIRHEDPEMATVFEQPHLKFAKDEIIEKVNQQLVNSYSNLYCPIENVTRRETVLYPEMTRKELRDLFVAVSYIFKDGEVSVNAIMDQVPSVERCATILHVFGMFCRL